MQFISPAFILAVLLTPAASEGTIGWATGFPIPMPLTGVALIRGNAKPDRGQTLIRASVTYWQSGGDGYTKNVTIDAKGNLGPVTISGLERGATYNVVMDVVQVRNGKEVTLRTAPAKIKVR